MFGDVGFPEMMRGTIAVAVYIVVIAWPMARICQRAGFSPWLGALALVPVANVLLLWYVALMPWPGQYRYGATLDRPARFSRP